jgi:hypothetical protein
LKDSICAGTRRIDGQIIRPEDRWFGTGTAALGIIRISDPAALIEVAAKAENNTGDI